MAKRTLRSRGWKDSCNLVLHQRLIRRYSDHLRDGRQVILRCFITFTFTKCGGIRISVAISGCTMYVSLSEIAPCLWICLFPSCCLDIKLKHCFSYWLMLWMVPNWKHYKLIPSFSWNKIKGYCLLKSWSSLTNLKKEIAMMSKYVALSNHQGLSI